MTSLGPAYFDNIVECGEEVTVNGTLSAQGGLDVENGAHITNGLHSDNISVSGVALFDSNITVEGVSQFVKEIIAFGIEVGEGNLNCDNNLTVKHTSILNAVDANIVAISSSDITVYVPLFPSALTLFRMLYFL